ncbi:glycosyltransferase [Streptomyces sp. NPDC058045]|uniref:glycosyltransferase n=1 Tax=Streptomyces sp. NPDC058045 TaxID=3346311 RepID=UPI0036F181EA
MSAPDHGTGTGGRDILLVANSVDELGGVTTWSHRMARLFTARGHRVHLVGIRPAPAQLTQHLGELPYPTTTLHPEHPPPVPRGRGPVAGLRRRRREAGARRHAAPLTRLCRAARPGAVVIVAQVWAMEWVARADTAGLPVIGMSHESYQATRGSSRFGRCLTYYRDVARMLALTREDADLWITRGGLDNVGHLPNPLPAPPAEPSPRTEPVVLSVGRLGDEKGIDLLLDTWAECAPRHPGWRLRIHGDGEDEAALRARCTALGLDGGVEWAGRTDDVAGALRRASLFVLPSRSEGFPLALMEAMAAGLPGAAFDCAPGVREIVRDGEDGLLAAPGNTSELARRLDELIADRELRDTLGDAARRNIRRYSAEEVLHRWEELFTLLER